MIKLGELFKSRSLDHITAHLQMPLYRNGYALILSATAMAGFGILYWILAARIYSTEVVGLNSAAIATMTLLASIAELSLHTAMTRFIPRSGQAIKRLVGYTYITILTLSAIVSIVFYFIVHIFFQSQSFFDTRSINIIWFAISTMTWGIFTIQDSVLTGLRKTNIVLIENTIFSIGKIIGLIFFAKLLPNSGIFMSWITPGIFLVLPINFLIFWRYIPRHIQETASTSEKIISKNITTYVIGNYISSLFLFASTLLLPLIITQKLGATANAYFYLPWTITTALQLVASNMATSLTVEGAIDQTKLTSYTSKILINIIRLLIPIVITIFIGAHYILSIFRNDYAVEGTFLLRLLAISTIPNAVVAVYIGFVRAKKHVFGLIMVQSTLCALTIGLSYLLLPVFGINGVGIAWFCSQSITALFLLITPMRDLIKYKNT